MSSKKQKRIVPEADSDPHHISIMEVSVKNFTVFKLLNIYSKSSILDV